MYCNSTSCLVQELNFKRILNSFLKVQDRNGNGAQESHVLFIFFFLGTRDDKTGGCLSFFGQCMILRRRELPSLTMLQISLPLLKPLHLCCSWSSTISVRAKVSSVEVSTQSFQKAWTVAMGTNEIYILYNKYHSQHLWVKQAEQVGTVFFWIDVI